MLTGGRGVVHPLGHSVRAVGYPRNAAAPVGELAAAVAAAAVNSAATATASIALKAGLRA